jgi:hypothetical protein
MPNTLPRASARNLAAAGGAEIGLDRLPWRFWQIRRSARGPSRREDGPSSRSIRRLGCALQFFFLRTGARADAPLVIKLAGAAAAGVLFAFGFLASRLPRLRSFAIRSPLAPTRRGPRKIKGPAIFWRRGAVGRQALFGHDATSPRRRYIRGRPRCGDTGCLRTRWSKRLSAQTVEIAFSGEKI